MGALYPSALCMTFTILVLIVMTTDNYEHDKNSHNCGDDGHDDDKDEHASGDDDDKATLADIPSLTSALFA